MIRTLIKCAIPALALVMVFIAVAMGMKSGEAARPQTGENIEWRVLSGGGTRGASASYILEGTVGQTATGMGASAAYNIHHGFWQTFAPASCCDMAGDANNDGKVNVGDAVYLIGYVFRGGPGPPCLQEGDANGDSKINVGDAVYIISYVFRGGPAPICGPSLP
jgi:hypothetical protein